MLLGLYPFTKICWRLVGDGRELMGEGIDLGVTERCGDLSDRQAFCHCQRKRNGARSVSFLFLLLVAGGLEGERQ